MQITTLFIDIGGVLLNNGWGHTTRELAAKTFHLDCKEMQDRHSLTFDTYEIGKITLDEYLKRVVFYQDRTFTPEQFKAFMYEQSTAYPEMIQYIRDLKARHGLKVIVISNEGRELNANRIQKFKLDQFVDACISSSFVGLRKPDTDIFKLALDLAQTPLANIIYLDDRQMFIDVAATLGIQGICHTDVNTTRERLSTTYGLSL